MSGDVIRVSHPSSASSTPRSKLDTLSREELIYFVKKQVESLKLSKAENARLKLENSELTNALKDAEQKLEGIRENQDEVPKSQDEGHSALEKECELLRQETERLRRGNTELNSKVEELEKIHVTAQDINSSEQLLEEQNISKEIFDEKIRRLSELEKQNEELLCTVDELRSLLDDTNQQLSIVKEKRNVENVFSLEIADYERSVEKLQKDLKLSKENFEAINAELMKTREELGSVREEKLRVNTSGNKMKAAIVKLKSELNDKKELIEAKEKESVKLKLELERVNSEKEEEKLLLSTAIGHGEEKIQQLEDNVSSLNRQIISLRSVKDSLQHQYDDLLQEHNTFKARALYVLEQKKGDNVQHADEHVESLEETIRSQKKTIDNLTQSQRLLQDELLAEREHSLALNNKLQEVERHIISSNETNKRKLSEQRQQFESRLASESKLNSDLIAQIDANFAAHAREKERLSRELTEERRAFSVKCEELKRCFEEERKKFLETEHIRSMPNVVVPSQLKREISSDVSSLYLQRPPSAAENLANGVEETSGERTLEDVIYGDDVSECTVDTVERWGHFKESVNWEEAARKSQKQLENTQELLLESEAANARLMEQTKLLKGEIRRMERNGERTDHVANTEYLKNIILKFIAPEKVDSEREQLIPVLATMLRLSSDELQQLNAVARVDSPSSPAAEASSKPSSWGSYLHRWSGLS